MAKCLHGSTCFHRYISKGTFAYVRCPVVPSERLLRYRPKSSFNSAARYSWHFISLPLLLRTYFPYWFWPEITATYYEGSFRHGKQLLAYWSLCPWRPLPATCKTVRSRCEELPILCAVLVEYQARSLPTSTACLHRKAHRADGLRFASPAWFSRYFTHETCLPGVSALCPSMWWKPIIHPHFNSSIAFDKSSCVYGLEVACLRSYAPVLPQLPHRIPGKLPNGMLGYDIESCMLQNLVLQWFQMQPSRVSVFSWSRESIIPKWDLSQWHESCVPDMAMGRKPPIPALGSKWTHFEAVFAERGVYLPHHCINKEFRV